jgi:hypothetical protein
LCEQVRDRVTGIEAITEIRDKIDLDSSTGVFRKRLREIVSLLNLGFSGGIERSDDQTAICILSK